MVDDSVRTDGATTGISYESTSVQEGDGVFSPSESPQWLEDLERSRHWHRLIPVGVAVWFIALSIAAALEGTALNVVADLIGYGIVLPALVVLPGMWYLDMRYVRSVSDWDIDARKWLVGGILLPPFVVPFYYYRRYSVLGL